MLTISWLIIFLVFNFGLGLGPVVSALCAVGIDQIMRVWIRETFTENKKPAKKVKVSKPYPIPTIEEMDKILDRWTLKSVLDRKVDDRVHGEIKESDLKYMPKAN